MPVLSSPASKAWATRRSPAYKARRTAAASQRSLAAWAAAKGWRCQFLDAQSGHPRTGIIDAVLVRTKSGAPDTLEVKLVQLKSGSAGITAAEVRRLKRATELIEVGHLVVLAEGDHLEFSPEEPP